MTIEVDGNLGTAINEKIQGLPNIYSSIMLQPI